jgi:hypothetical protein
MSIANTFSLDPVNESKLVFELEKAIPIIANEMDPLFLYLDDLQPNNSLRIKEEKINFINQNIENKINSFILLPIFRPIAFGFTKNNIDQFNWLDLQLKRHSPNLTLVNVAIKPWSDFKGNISISKPTKIKLAKIIIEATSNYKDNSYKVGYIIKFSISFIKYFLSFYFLRKDFCPFICVANDHSPMNVAFSKAAKVFGLFRIYLQHSSITHLFPNLDFELSILFNKISANIYGADNRLLRDVLIIPRFPLETKNKLSLYKDEILSSKKRIVIYLGGSNNILTLIKAIENLSSNNLIQSIYIKLHPNPRNHGVKDQLIQIFGNEIIGTDYVSYPHIAICGNTSVILNLLSIGIRCYHLFDLDTRRRDYYGFAASSAAKVLSINDLSTNFWTNWDEEKYLRVSKKYIDDIFSEEIEYNLINFDLIIRNKLKKYNSIIYRDKNIFKHIDTSEFNFDHIFYITKDEATYLNLLIYKGRFSKPAEGYILSPLNSQEKISLVNRTYRFRHPAAIDLMTLLIKYDSSQWVRIYFKYHLNFLVGLKDSNQVKSDIDFIYSSKCELRNPEIVTSIILIFASSMGWKFVLNLLDYLKKYPVNYNKISAKCWAKIYLILPNQEQIEFLNNPKFGLLQKNIKQIKFDLYKSETHEELVNLYLSPNFGNNNKRLADIFNSIEDWIRKNIIEDLRLARSHEIYIDFFWNLVKDALSERRGFSFIRLSDGEAYIYSSSTFTEEDCANRERHWWACELHPAHRFRLQHQLKIAAQRCDVVGLPSIFRFVRDFSVDNLNDVNLCGTVQKRAILEVIDGYLSSNPRPVAVAEERSNDYFFRNILTRIKSLSHLIEMTVVISSLSEDVTEKLFSENGPIISIRVPTRSRTFNQPGRNFKIDTILPYEYKEIIKQIQRYCKPGTLLLVASGVIGKIFIDEGKQMGAVALDLGEVIEHLDLKNNL